MVSERSPWSDHQSAPQALPQNRLGEPHLNALARQHVRKQRIGATVQLRNGNNVIAGGGQLRIA